MRASGKWAALNKTQARVKWPAASVESRSRPVRMASSASAKCCSIRRDHAQAKVCRSVAACTQFDGLCKRCFGVRIAPQVQVGDADLVVGLVEIRKRFDGLLKFGDAGGRVIRGDELGAVVLRFDGFLRDTQFTGGNLGGGAVRERRGVRLRRQLGGATQRQKQKRKQA